MFQNTMGAQSIAEDLDRRSIYNFNKCKYLKVHKNENFFGFDFECCTFSLIVMQK
jgi:hypothetical protein